MSEPAVLYTKADMEAASELAVAAVRNVMNDALARRDEEIKALRAALPSSIAEPFDLADRLRGMAKHIEQSGMNFSVVGESAAWWAGNLILAAAALDTRSAIERSIPIDASLIANAKEARRVGMTRVTMSVPVDDILGATDSASEK